MHFANSRPATLALQSRAHRPSLLITHGPILFTCHVRETKSGREVLFAVYSHIRPSLTQTTTTTHSFGRRHKANILSKIIGTCRDLSILSEQLPTSCYTNGAMQQALNNKGHRKLGGFTQTSAKPSLLVVMQMEQSRRALARRCFNCNGA